MSPKHLRVLSFSTYTRGMFEVVYTLDKIMKLLCLLNINRGVLKGGNMSCSICYQDCKPEELFKLCSTCVGDDKQVCNSCNAKLLLTTGTALDDNKVITTINCPFCRVEISQSSIDSSGFSKSYEYFATMYSKLRIATELVCRDRTDLRDIVTHLRVNPGQAEAPFLAWQRMRRLRPVQLDENIQREYFAVAQLDALDYDRTNNTGE